MEKNRIIQIVVSHTSGRISEKEIIGIKDYIKSITGQTPCTTYAKKGVANWKARAGMITGCMVTLRRHRVEFFLAKLVNFCFFKHRNFQGFNPKGKLTYNQLQFGYDDLTCFPETESVDTPTPGINISILTNCKSKEENLVFLKSFNIPINE